MARFPKRKTQDDDPETAGSEDGAKRRRRRRERSPSSRRERLAASSSADPGDSPEAESPKAEGPRKRRRAPKPAGASSATATASAKKAAGKVLDPVHKAFVTVLAILGAVLAGIFGVIAVVVRKAGPPANAIRKRVAALLQALSRVLTPARGLLVAAIACAVLLALSQFADYRSVSIGADAYDPSIASVAPAPEVERAEAGSAHSYLFVPIAILAIGLLGVAARRGRWQLCRLVVLIGLAAIVVAILIDRPAGLDEGTLNRDFTGVEAKLLGGFWMQIFAGGGLALTSFLLSGELRREADARAGRPARREDPKSERRRPFARKRATGESTAEGAGA